jgi:hypothetical protein
METAIAIIVGVCLSAACGFRVFVPLLAMSLAAQAGMLEFSNGWEWVGSLPSVIAFAVATAVEVGAFYIPWLDNALDTIASPVAVVAGIIVTAAMVSDLDPFLKWSLAIIAGGGAAGLTQGLSVLLRGTSTATTAGMGNFVVSSVELLLSAVVSLLAVFAPLVALVAVVAIVALGLRLYRRLRRRKATLAEVKGK